MKQNIDPTINHCSRNIKFWRNSPHLLPAYVSHNITTLETPRTVDGVTRTVCNTLNWVEGGADYDDEEEED